MMDVETELHAFSKLDGQIHALATSPMQKRPMVPTEKKDPREGLEVSLPKKKKKKNLLSARNETMIPWSSIKLHESV
jgi:hypothetical protein